MNVKISIFIYNFAKICSFVLEHDDVEDSGHNFFKVLKIGHLIVVLLVGQSDKIVKVHHDLFGVVSIFSKFELNSTLPQQVVLVIFPVVDVEIFYHVFNFFVDVDCICLRILIAKMV